MIHLQNLPHLHNDRDAIRFPRCAAHTDALPYLVGDYCEERFPASSRDARA